MGSVDKNKPVTEVAPGSLPRDKAAGSSREPATVAQAREARQIDPLKWQWYTRATEPRPPVAVVVVAFKVTESAVAGGG